MTFESTHNKIFVDQRSRLPPPTAARWTSFYWLVNWTNLGLRVIIMVSCCESSGSNCGESETIKVSESNGSNINGDHDVTLSRLNLPCI